MSIEHPSTPHRPLEHVRPPAVAFAFESNSSAGQVIVATLVPGNFHTQVPPSPPPPLPELYSLTTDPSTVFDIARIDTSGRFSSKEIVEHLNWPPERRFDVHVAQDAALLIPSPFGQHRVSRHHLIGIPARVRRILGVQPSHKVLLIGFPQHKIILVHGHRILNAMAVCYFQSLTGRGR